MKREAKLKALKLIEALSEECDVMTDGDHAWQRCRACLARGQCPQCVDDPHCPDCGCQLFEEYHDWDCGYAE